MGKEKENPAKTRKVELDNMELTLLQIAIDKHIAKLNSILKQARFYGVEVSKATQHDVQFLEGVKKKLEGQEELIKNKPTKEE